MNNLTKIYLDSAMLQSLVATCAIYGRLAEGVDGAHLHEWLLDESEHAEMQNTALESTTAASDARIAELTRQRDAAIDAYERLVRHDTENGYMKLPEGWTTEQASEVLDLWPRWDDGSPCVFGDEFTCYPKYDSKKEYKVFDRLVIYGPNHVWSRGCDREQPHDGGYYEWNFMRPGGDGCEEYRPTKRKPRTIEDVLATFRFDAKNIYDDPTLDGNERVDELEALDADVAAELRDLMEVD